MHQIQRLGAAAVFDEFDGDVHFIDFGADVVIDLMKQRLFLRVGIGGIDAGRELLKLVQNGGFAVCVEW